MSKTYVGHTTEGTKKRLIKPNEHIPPGCIEARGRLEAARNEITRACLNIGIAKGRYDMANKMAQHYGILAASFAIGGGAFSLEMVFGIVTGAWLIIAAIFAGMAWKFKKAADAAKKEMEVAREEYNIALQEFDGAKDDVLSDCPPKYQGDTTIPTCQYV